MTFSNIDRTAEVEACDDEISVKSTDHCCFFEKHPDTMLWRKECWTCRYSDFGIELGTPTTKGLCKLKTKKLMKRYI